MTFFEQVEVTAKLSKVSCKRPLNSTEKTAFGLIFTLCEEGKKLENANQDLWERVQKMEDALEFLADDLLIPDCRDCPFRVECENPANKHIPCRARFIARVKKYLGIEEAAKEAENGQG